MILVGVYEVFTEVYIYRSHTPISVRLCSLCFFFFFKKGNPKYPFIPSLLSLLARYIPLLASAVSLSLSLSLSPHRIYTCAIGPILCCTTKIFAS